MLLLLCHGINDDIVDHMMVLLHSSLSSEAPMSCVGLTLSLHDVYELSRYFRSGTLTIVFLLYYQPPPNFQDHAFSRRDPIASPTVWNSLPDERGDPVCGFDSLGSCCSCDSPAALLLSSVVQVEEVRDRSRVVLQVLHCKLRRMALTNVKCQMSKTFIGGAVCREFESEAPTVEQMLYGVWCHSTLRTDI